MASITCANCQTVSAEGTAFCPGCGNALSGATQAAYTAPPPAPPAPPAPPGPPPQGAPRPAADTNPRPQVNFDLKSIGHADRLAGGGTLVLFIALFLPWFKVDFTFGTASASGLSIHGYLYITLILCLAIIAFVIVEALGVWKLPSSSQVGREQLLLIATTINLVLVLIAFLFKPGGHGVGWDWGAFVALVAAVVAVFPLAAPAIQARRSK
jgi:hypothetical protein